MLSVDARVQADASWCGYAALGDMLQVEEPAAATAEPIYDVADDDAGRSRCPEKFSSESSDEVVLSIIDTPPREQEPGDGSNQKLHCQRPMNSFSAVAKEKVLLLDDSLESDLSCELSQHIRSDAVSFNDLVVPLRRVFSTMPGGIVLGTKESPGYRSKMEDYTAVIEDFTVLTTLAGARENLIPPALESSLHAVGCQDISGCHEIPEPLLLTTAALSFVGVFDGHGGTEVAEKLAKQLPHYVAQKLRMQEKYAMSGRTVPREASSDGAGRTVKQGQTTGSFSQSFWQTHVRQDTQKSLLHLQTPFRESMETSISGDMDIDSDDTVFPFEKEPSLNTGYEAEERPPLTLEEIEFALTTAFTDLNDSLPDTPEKTVGSTAVVALISACHVIIANVGDSRAVLRRNGRTFRLSRDHKPDQEDEEERIRMKGGRVWDFNGRRVMGLLAMTRAFGDDCLKPFGICATPEVTIVSRVKEDEFLILACDGLWDVISDEEACHLVHRCFKRAEEREASSDAACRVAAVVLFRAAFTKGSTDNISVVVVDLRPKPTPNDLPE